MKIVSERSDKNRESCSPSTERGEFLESLEDHQSDAESPEDHCSGGESQAGPSRQYAKLSRGSR